MAVIELPDTKPWFASRWGARLLYAEAESRATRADDLQALKEALASEGLFFERKSPNQAIRLAKVLRDSAESVSGRLRTAPSDSRDLELANALDELSSLLEEYCTAVDNA